MLVGGSLQGWFPLTGLPWNLDAVPDIFVGPPPTFDGAVLAEFWVQILFRPEYFRPSSSLQLALVGYEVIKTNSHYVLFGYFITSYPTWAPGIIVISLGISSKYSLSF